MLKRVSLAALASLLIVLPIRALAATPAPSNIYTSQKGSQPAGVIKGSIQSIDYAGETIVVRSNGVNQTIALTPSTIFYHGHEYATISDLHKGQNVSIDTTQVNGRLVAQVIRL